MSTPIVVGVDAEAFSADVLFWALAEARRRHAWVLLVHAADEAHAAAVPTARVTVGTRAAGLVRAYRHVATRLAPDVRTSGEVVSGSAPAVLVAASRRAQLLVLGSRGRAGMGLSALGSVSQQVATHAHCPVVVVPRGRSPLVTRRICVGVAGGAADHPVLDFAGAQARGTEATLCLVHARPAVAGGVPQEDGDAAAAYIRLHFPHVVVERAAVHADVIAALQGEAARSDLLVLGCRHTEAEFGCRIGAVPAGVLAEVTCPVALVGRPG